MNNISDVPSDEETVLDTRCVGLYDTGASLSAISKEKLAQLRTTCKYTRYPVSMADGSRVNCSGRKLNVPGHVGKFGGVLDDLLDKYEVLFQGLGQTKRLHHEIRLLNNKVVRHKFQDIPVHWHKELNTHIQELLQAGIIELSHSEFRSRIVPIKKKDGAIRLAVDYRDLNAISQTDAFPMPRIRDIVLKLAKSKIFSKIDLKKGYYQIPMHPDSKKYTAFAFGHKLYQFRFMPFGLVSAPQTFQRLMDAIFGNLDFVECYLDDVIIHSQTMEEHRRHLAQVFDILRVENLRLNREKCQFGTSEVEYLGLTITGGRRSITSGNKTKLLKFPSPSTSREAKTFICLASYYRDLISNFAALAKPIYDAANTDPFIWGDDQTTAFSKIKDSIRTHSGLLIPDVSKQFIVTTDASDTTMGGTLSQVLNGVKTPVDFFSRNFNKTQRRYSTYEKEATAILEALRHWRHFLLGRPFRIETDHKPLKWLLSKKDCSGKLGRMVLKLQEYQIENIDHIRGQDNVLADTLSRIQLNMITVPAPPLDEDEVIRQDKQNFTKKNERWFYVDKNGPVESYRLYIRNPEEQRTILKAVHDNGHLGLFKNQEEIRKRFWWPNWKKDVKAVLENCVLCQKFKDNIEKTRLPLTATPVEESNWRKVGLDICGPFQKSQKNNKYIIMLQDYASKFLTGTAVPVANTNAILQWLTDTFLVFGWPRVIVCDRGSQFESRQFKNFAKENNIQLVYATVGHHQTNGLIERANRTIESMIRTTAVDKTNWDTILNKMISAYNASVHHSTKLAPFKTMFGHDMVTPLDLQFGIEFRDTNWDTLKIARIEATSQMQNRQKEQYDKRAKQEEIAVGDLVLWHQVDQTARSSKKLNQRWRGPYKVVAREATNCKITDRRGTCRVIHQNHLKLFKGPSELDVIRNRGRPARSADPAGEVQHRER
ncbi:UNVERIFIED_CONTAM: hypothetical protein PYX00_006417 [Menopon gallinae]|uniref:RNA-directed DNA polymerase n=1 Tax=Menopon gallinae TaxID=328185 RepID=A0AAW2HVU2_9NEOP